MKDKEKELKITLSEYQEMKGHIDYLELQVLKLKDAFSFTEQVGITRIYTKEDLIKLIKLDNNKLWLKYRRLRKVFDTLFENKRFKRKNQALYSALELDSVDVSGL